MSKLITIDMDDNYFSSSSRLQQNRTALYFSSLLLSPWHVLLPLLPGVEINDIINSAYYYGIMV